MFCGIDWADRHHDIALVDDTGTLLAKARITEDAVGYNKLLDLLAEHGDSPDTPIPVAIEPAMAFSSPPCDPATARFSRSTRSPPPATATVPVSAARSPTRATPWPWRTSCTPACTPTGRCRPTPNPPRLSPGTDASTATPSTAKSYRPHAYCPKAAVPRAVHRTRERRVLGLGCATWPWCRASPGAGWPCRRPRKWRSGRW